MDSSKVLVKIILPEMDKSYDMYLPINRKVGNTIKLINKMLNEITLGEYKASIHQCLYNKLTGMIYDNGALIVDTDIRNGSSLVLL